jgi:hypothetical protein
MIFKGAFFYKNGTIRIASLSLPGFGNNGSTRGAIRKLSSKSRQRLALVVNETSVDFKSILTLTYPKEFPGDGKRVKQDLRFMLTRLERNFPCLGFLWILEFQERGAPHFHILLDCVPDNIDRYYVAQEWAYRVAAKREEQDKVFFQHARKEHFEEIRSKNGAKNYMTKYALKPYQKKVPLEYLSTGRFWGCNSKVINGIEKPIYVNMSKDDLRKVLRAQNSPVSEWENLPLIIFSRENVSRETIDN